MARHVVDERGESVGDVPVLDPQNVLGILLAAVRAVVAPGEHLAVDHHGLRVHVIVDRVRPVWGLATPTWAPTGAPPVLSLVGTMTL